MQALYFAQPQKIVIVMVGLPARGKSYISKKIVRFLSWLGYNSEVFNIGNYRRQFMKRKGLPLDVSYFDNEHQNYQVQREQIAQLALDDLVDYLNGKGHIGILDGTNSTVERRKKIKSQIQKKIKGKYFLFFIESLCQDKQVIEQNIKNVKIYNPDYKGKSPQFATQDFYQRISLYGKYYKEIDKSQDIPYLKTINLGQDFLVHAIYGYLPQKIVTYVMNLTISPNRIIYLLRHGETIYNQEDRIGGNPELNECGIEFSKSLRKFFETEDLPDKQKTRILTSTLKRTIQTGKQIQINHQDIIQLKVLDQLNAGICQTMTYLEIEEKYPEISEERSKDKLRYRYPSGQSYLDLISRLESVIQWIERQKTPIIVVAHQAVLRCFHAYFFKIDEPQIPYIQIELHTVIKLIPETYFFNQKIFYLDVEQKKVSKVVQVEKKESIDMTLFNFKKNTEKKFKQN